MSVETSHTPWTPIPIPTEALCSPSFPSRSPSLVRSFPFVSSTHTREYDEIKLGKLCQASWVVAGDDDDDQHDDDDDDDGSHQQRHPQTSAAVAARLFGWSTGCCPLLLLPARPGLKSNPRPAEPQLRLGLQFQFFFPRFWAKRKRM